MTSDSTDLRRFVRRERLRLGLQAQSDNPPTVEDYSHMDRVTPGWRNRTAGLARPSAAAIAAARGDTEIQGVRCNRSGCPRCQPPGPPVSTPRLLARDGTVHADVPGQAWRPVTTAGLEFQDLTVTGQPRVAPHMLGRLAPPATNAVGIPITGPTGPLFR